MFFRHSRRCHREICCRHVPAWLPQRVRCRRPPVFSGGRGTPPHENKIMADMVFNTADMVKNLLTTISMNY